MDDHPFKWLSARARRSNTLIVGHQLVMGRHTVKGVFQLVAACMMLGVGATASAAGSTVQTNILQMSINGSTINSSTGNFVWIQAAAAPTGSPSCVNGSGGSWHFTLSLDTAYGKSLYAMLLAAEVAGKLVLLTGTGLCSQVSSVESLSAANIFN
jgi:hypothetical protein